MEVVTLREIDINENLIRRIVRAIDKAVADDVPQYLRENYKETNNAIPHLRGDFINDNLRLQVVGENIELIAFQRYAWEGRLIVDRVNKITYTVTTQQTLKLIPKKQRSKPHFLQTLLHNENDCYEASIEQLELLEPIIFDEDIFQDDYTSIVGNLIDPAEGYRHYVIAYEAKKSELIDVQLEFLDKNFKLIEGVCLNEYIKPDFARITSPDLTIEVYSDNKDEEAKSLISIKSGLRPKLREIEDQA